MREKHRTCTSRCARRNSSGALLRCFFPHLLSSSTENFFFLREDAGACFATSLREIMWRERREGDGGRYIRALNVENKNYANQIWTGPWNGLTRIARIKLTLHTKEGGERSRQFKLVSLALCVPGRFSVRGNFSELAPSLSLARETRHVNGIIERASMCIKSHGVSAGIWQAHRRQKLFARARSPHSVPGLVSFPPCVARCPWFPC